MSDFPKLGIVIPTLGQRRDYLVETINSVKSFGDVFIILIVPEETRENIEEILGINKVITEDLPGLPAAINQGVKMMPEEIEYVGWIGDDDLLSSNAGYVSIDYLDQNPNCVMTFGICNYINQNGEIIGINRSGQWAVPLLHFGPDLIPQPGSIYRKSIFEKIGGIDTSFALAFDFDLFIRLSKAGSVKFLGIEVGSFRWHSDSKTVKTRGTSVLEASRIRRMNLPSLVKGISWFWELPVLVATYLAGLVVTQRAKKSLKS